MKIGNICNLLYHNLCVLPNSFISDTTTVYTKTCLIGTQILGELEYENCTLGSREYAVCIEKSLFWILMIFVEWKAKSRSWIHFNTTQVEQVVPKLKAFFTVSHCFNLQHCNFWANVIHELCKAALLQSRGVRWGISSGARWSWGDPFKGLCTYYIKSKIKNNWKQNWGLGGITGVT